jgi:hypothetical protein
MLAFNASVGNALAGSSRNEGPSLLRSVPMRAKRNPIENSAIPEPRSGSVVARSAGGRVNLQSHNHSLRARQTAAGYLQSFGAKPSGTSYRDISTHAQTLSFSKLPMSFEPNVGQADSPVKFVSHGNGYKLFLTSTGPELVLSQSPTAKAAMTPSLPNALLRNSNNHRLHIKFVGANAHSEISALDELPGKVNYFLGNDPNQWRRDIATFRRVTYKNLYPGINIVYHGSQGKLEHDFVLSPGADPGSIQFAFDGAEKIRLAANGDLMLHVP